MSLPPTPAPPGERAVDISDLEFGWARGESLLAIDHFGIAPGERVLLTGPSGSGKSTLLGLIAGVLIPRAGEVRVADTAIHALAAGARDRFRGAHIGFIFQMFNLVPYLDVIANVLLPLRFSTSGALASAARSPSTRRCASLPHSESPMRRAPVDRSDSCRWASSSVWRQLGRSSGGPSCCSPTNRPRRLMRPRAPIFCSCS